MVILKGQNKITDFFMILAWASPFKQLPCSILVEIICSAKVDLITMFLCYVVFVCCS